MITFKPLKRLLVEKEMSITELQRILNISEHFTTNVRDNKSVNTKIIGKICKYFNCQPNNIISYEED